MKNELDRFRGFPAPARDAFRDMFQMSRRLNSMFDDWFGPSLWESDAGGQLWGPSGLGNWDEAEDHYLLSLDLPGVGKDDLHVEIKGQDLMLSGERKFRQGNAESSQRFSQTVRLPEDGDAEKLEASLRDGVLRIAIPRSAASQARRIPIGEGDQGFFAKIASKAKDAISGADKEGPQAGVEGRDKAA